jgi:hypothetical protein
VYTASDLVDYLLSSTGGGAQDQEHRLLRQSVFHAYRDVCSAREWRWFHTVETVTVTRGLYRKVLPYGVLNIDSVEFPVWRFMAQYLAPRDFDRLLLYEYGQRGQRLAWTVKPSSVFPNRYDLLVLNDLGDESEAALTYRRRPRDLRFTGWEPGNRVGKIDWSGTQIMGSGTEFPALAEGAVIRASGDPAYHPESLGGMHPYVAEGLIYKVSHKNKLYAWSDPDLQGRNPELTGSRYYITDLLDISPAMYTACITGAEYWAARLMGKNVEGTYQVFQKDLRMAFEQDAMAPISGRQDGNCWFGRFWYLQAGTDQGGGGCGTGGPNENGPCPIPPDASGGDSTTDGNCQIHGGGASTQYEDCQ